MKKISVMEIADHEGCIDGVKLCEALSNGGVTLYGMDMDTIKRLRADYLHRHGFFPPGPELRFGAAPSPEEKK